MADNVGIKDGSGASVEVSTTELPDGSQASNILQIDANGDAVIPYSPVAIALGQIPGYSSVNKFGENPDVDTGTGPEDVWDYGGMYTFSTSADITQISSDDNSDTQVLTVIGLNSAWAEVTQTKTLTGTTPATLDTPLIRVYRAYNSEIGRAHV